MPDPKSPPRAPDLRLTPASDAELDAAAEVTPADRARAAASWRADASLPFQALLDAEDEGAGGEET